MPRFFIKAKGQEAFVDAPSLQEAFVAFVRQTPLDQLGAILIGHSEYFILDAIPEESIATRVTIPLVKASIWTEEEAKDFNEAICGERII